MEVSSLFCFFAGRTDLHIYLFKLLYSMQSKNKFV